MDAVTKHLHYNRLKIYIFFGTSVEPRKFLMSKSGNTLLLANLIKRVSAWNHVKDTVKLCSLGPGLEHRMYFTIRFANYIDAT